MACSSAGCTQVLLSLVQACSTGMCYVDDSGMRDDRLFAAACTGCRCYMSVVCTACLVHGCVRPVVRSLESVSE
jgi:hypothetical protein